MDELPQILIDTLSGFSMTNKVLLLVNVLLLLFSRQIVRRISPSETKGEKQVRLLHIFRAANLLVLLFILFFKFFLPLAVHFWITRVLAALLVGYLGYLGFHIVNYMIKKRFGHEREISGKMVLAETYNSRALSMIAAVFVFIVVLIAVVRIFGFDSLLEAGGVIGFIGVLLALTQSAWAPDIISGLIILNSKLVEEGDVIEFADSGSITGVVFKTKVFHTEILNLVNNHRIMIQNFRLRQQTIHNLSKFASARGLREALQFNIGYDVEQTRVQAMFHAAFEEAARNVDIRIEAQSGLEVRAADAGDFAVRWSVFYYTKNVKHLLRTRQLFLGLILKQAREKGIVLATPVQYEHTGGDRTPLETGDRYAQATGKIE